MAYYFTHDNGLVTALYDDTYNPTIPGAAVKISDDNYRAALGYQENGYIMATDGHIITAGKITPTRQEQEATERLWAKHELAKSDHILLRDSGYTEDEKLKVEAYRAKLRNPTRTTHQNFPAITWRPTWPAGVKEPD